MKFLLLITVLFFTCSKNSEPSRSKIRVISLAPSLTEIVFALGRGDDLVGVTTFCNYPPEATQKYKVGDFSNPSLERILVAKPDIILLSLPEQMRIKNELEKLNLKFFNSSPTSIDDILGDIKEIGKILRVETRSDSLIDSLKKELAAIMAEVGKDTPKVFIEISPQPLVSVGGKSYINEAVAKAGGINIFRDLKVDYPVVSQEELLKRNPDVIFILHKQELGKRLSWHKIKAVKMNHLCYDLDQDLIFRPGPRIVEGIKLMHEHLKF